MKNWNEKENKIPNYVYGTLSVTGTKEGLLKFKEFAKGEEEDISYKKNLCPILEKTSLLLSMNKFIPYPARFRKIDRELVKYHNKIKEVKEKVENGKELSDEEKKLVNELALCELQDIKLPYQKDGFNSGGHEWCVINRGTKSDFWNTELQETDKELLYTFSTAWSVPMPVLFKMSQMFPILTFEYFGEEEGDEFKVDYIFKEGVMTIQNEKNWQDIKIEKIEGGEIDDWDYDMKLYEELKQHKGHKVNYDGDKHFLCETCNNKIIWDTSK